MKKGTFYAVGVGPGDPELLTQKALRILQGCAVIAAPRGKGGAMTALSIAARAVDLSQKTIVPLPLAMENCAADRSGRGVDSGLTADGRRLELAGGHGIERRDRDAGLPLGCFDEQKRTPANPMVAGLADRADRVVLRVASFDAFLAARLRHGTAVRGCRLSLAASFASAACVYALFSGSSALDAAAGCRESKGLDFE